jgi:3' terminal RNA ribose 2'-O-methyltransferase Hen1
VLLTLSTTLEPATDLGFLLHKHPDRVQEFALSFGKAYVFYPEASPSRCTAALLVEVDPIGLVRGRRGPAGDGFALEQYVNDRPYVASSFLAVAISEVFGTALAGRSAQHETLANTALPFEVRLPSLPSRGGASLVERLFSPLGYQVETREGLLDTSFPDWGPSPVLDVTLRASLRLQALLRHLTVLIPALDGDKHYWIGDDEVEKLLRRGEGWLSSHPERELIADRYLKRRASLVRAALARLVADEPAGAEGPIAGDCEEEKVERPLSLAAQRSGAVLAVLRDSGARSVADLGCGEGHLLRALLDEPGFERILGLDVSLRALEVAERRLGLERLPPRKRERIQLLHGSLSYRDARLAGFDALTLIEVMEHLDPPRLAALERCVFEFAKPGVVIVTTPNVEYNVRFADLPAGRLRHRDHRFEWTRAEFAAWTDGVAERFGYAARRIGIGPEDADVGTPTQMAIFRRV